MMPAADHKGSALALLVDVMSGGGGSNFSFEATSFGDTVGGLPDVGQVVLAIDPTATMGDGFVDRIEQELRPSRPSLSACPATAGCSTGVLRPAMVSRCQDDLMALLRAYAADGSPARRTAERLARQRGQSAEQADVRAGCVTTAVAAMEPSAMAAATDGIPTPVSPAANTPATLVSPVGPISIASAAGLGGELQAELGGEVAALMEYGGHGKAAAGSFGAVGEPDRRQLVARAVTPATCRSSTATPAAARRSWSSSVRPAGPFVSSVTSELHAVSSRA